MQKVEGSNPFRLLQIGSSLERDAAMDFRLVTIADNFESYVFELYAALMLDTPYSSWATS